MSTPWSDAEPPTGPEPAQPSGADPAHPGGDGTVPPPSGYGYGPPSANGYGPPSASGYGPPSASGYGPPSAWAPRVPQQPGPPVVDPYLPPPHSADRAPDAYPSHGQDYGPAPTWPGQVHVTDPLAVPALVVGLVGLLCFPLVGPVGLVLGIVALRRIKRTGTQGRGMAIAGVVLGAVGTAILLLSVVAWTYLLSTGQW